MIARCSLGFLVHVTEFILVVLFVCQLDDSLDLDQLARLTDGLSGSDLREVCRSAAISRVLMSVDLDESSDDEYKDRSDDNGRVNGLLSYLCYWNIGISMS